jgi:hypothetical protein
MLALKGKALAALRKLDAAEKAKAERVARRQDAAMRRMVRKDGSVNAERFWAMCEPQGECLVWTGPTKSNHPNKDCKQYEVGCLDKSSHQFVQTHRVAVQLTLKLPSRVDPSIDIVQAVCGNRLCCNVDHMVARPHAASDRIAMSVPVREFYAVEAAAQATRDALESQANKLLGEAA